MMGWLVCVRRDETVTSQESKYIECDERFLSSAGVQVPMYMESRSVRLWRSCEMMSWWEQGRRYGCMKVFI